MAQIVASPGERVTLNCSLPNQNREPLWYKEKEDASLHRIDVSLFFSRPEGKYSAQKENQTSQFSLNINNVQKNDSGVYYCINWYPTPLKGTRLLITSEHPLQSSVKYPVQTLPRTIVCFLHLFVTVCQVKYTHIYTNQFLIHCGL